MMRMKSGRLDVDDCKRAWHLREPNRDRERWRFRRGHRMERWRRLVRDVRAIKPDRLRCLKKLRLLALVDAGFVVAEE